MMWPLYMVALSAANTFLAVKTGWALAYAMAVFCFGAALILQLNG